MMILDDFIVDSFSHMLSSSSQNLQGYSGNLCHQKYQLTA